MTTDLAFCGREAELAVLAERWALASDVDSPKPQLVLLTAEPGVGKTRLALEFLRRQAAAQPDGATYWPDASELASGRLHLNFAAETCRLDRPIPFLWWGIAAQAEGGDSVALHDRFLAPHLVAMSMRARMMGTGMSLAKIWGAAGVDALANTLQVDTVLSIGTALFDSVKLLKGHFGLGATDHRLAGETVVKNRVDALIADLEQVMNPAARLGYARTPAIVFIDDAQFARADPGLLRFVERLTHAAMTQRWPLMLVMTHWQTEWRIDTERDGRSIAALIHHARHGGREEPGPISGTTGGGYLNDGNYREIRLAKLGDLDPALSSALPGLPPAQRKALLGAVDGNPRFLEQVVAYLRGEPRLFEDFEPTAALTEEGLAEALSRSQRVHEVVLARLTSAEVAPEVREALALASVQGVRVLRDVVEAGGRTLLGHDLREPLLRGQDPFSVMAFETGGAVGSFTERLFLDAAARLRRNIKGLHDDGAVRRALRPALLDLLLEQMEREDPTLDRNVMGACVATAPTLIDDAEDVEQRFLAALAAMAEIVIADEKAVLIDALRRIVESLHQGLDDDVSVELIGRLPQLAIAAAAQAALDLDKLELAGWLGGRRYEWLNRTYNQTISVESATPCAMWIDFLGEVKWREGALDLAMERFTAADQYYEFVLAREPTRKAVFGRAGTLSNLSRLAAEMGRPEAALGFLAAMSSHYQKASDSGIIDEQEKARGIALSLNAQIGLLLAAGNDAAAVGAEQMCLMLTRQIAARGEPGDRNNLSRLLNLLADHQTNAADALAMANESVGIMYDLLEDAPSRLALQYDLIVALTVRARVHDRADALAERRQDVITAFIVAENMHERAGAQESSDALRSTLRNLVEATTQMGDLVRARPLIARLATMYPAGSRSRAAIERNLVEVDQQIVATHGKDLDVGAIPLQHAAAEVMRGGDLGAAGAMRPAYDAFASAFDHLMPQLQYDRDEAPLQIASQALLGMVGTALSCQPQLAEEDWRDLASLALTTIGAALQQMNGGLALGIAGGMLALLRAAGRADRIAEFQAVVDGVRATGAKAPS